MKNQLLVTAFGEDRPGLVARLTEVFVKNGANVEESRMSLLGGDFAAIILVSVEQEKMDALHRDTQKLHDEGIVVTAKLTNRHDPARFAAHQPYEITVDGADHEGIVHRVSAFLSQKTINIQSMETEVVPAPETGTPLFRMRAHVMVPRSMNLAELKSQLRHIANEEAVDITVGECAHSATHSGLQPSRS